MTDLLKFSIPGKPEYVQMVRLAIGSIAGNANFDMDAVEDIQLSVAEACKNVFCHGFSGYSNCYEVLCEITEEAMVINVADNCMGHDIVKQKKPCTNCPDDGNLGILVIKSLMDDVEVEEDEAGNKKIKMVKNK